MQSEWSHSCHENWMNSFLPRNCCNIHKKHEKWEPSFFKEKLTCKEELCLCSRTYWCHDNKSDMFQFRCKSLDKKLPKNPRNGFIAKYSRILDEVVISHLKTEDSELIFMLLLHVNRQKKDLFNFTQNSNFKIMKFIQNHWKYKKTSNVVNHFCGRILYQFCISLWWTNYSKHGLNAFLVNFFFKVF